MRRRNQGLDEIRSEADMRRALEDLDPGLEHEIKREIGRKIDREWEHALYETDHMEAFEFADMVGDDTLQEILDAMISRDGGEAELDILPHELVMKALREEVQLAAEAMTSHLHGRRSRAATGSNILSFTTGRGGGVQLRPVYAEIHLQFDEPLSWIPADRMRGFLNDVGPSEAQWAQSDVDKDSWLSGLVESGDEWRMEIEPYRGHEWAVDLRERYFSDIVDAGPDEAIEAMFNVLKQEHPGIYKKLKKAKLPKDVLADYAVAYLEDLETGIEVLSQAVGQFGYEGSRGEVLLEVDKAALQALGITSGRWWDAAPWKLVNLPPEELLYEGTLMRHCVGRRDMGYLQAVERGLTQIWSLRSRYNKPVVTFEIDMEKWDGGSGPATRAGAIKQLKGKLNRSVGEDADEARVLSWIFAKLGIDHDYVEDFVGAMPFGRLGNPGFNSPWRPYRQRKERTSARRTKSAKLANGHSDMADLKRKLMR